MTSLLPRITPVDFAFHMQISLEFLGIYSGSGFFLTAMQKVLYFFILGIIVILPFSLAAPIRSNEQIIFKENIDSAERIVAA